ncbi:ribosome small subunit-dependent GTPase A, partial [Candidatus Magnetaquicoccus inordinatus]|uniref:ribosome small subunit-dependent GTPase A n=1 Tax=Candidatus Magnetaquicoccus inordinatus TaxID=2496818 RepID=UPI00102BE59E
MIRKKRGSRDLSERQRGQIAHTEHKRSSSMAVHGEELLRCLGREAFGPEEEGLVIAHYGLNIEVEDGQGERFRCAVRKSSTGEPVCGDRILWMRAANGQGVINRILPRQSLLQRPLAGQRLQVIAANVQRIWIVFAATEPNMGLLDRYLVAAGVAGIAAAIVVNKIDLLADVAEAEARFAHYRQMGYAVYYVSTRDKRGMAELASGMRGFISVLVGESGTGKSSLLAEWVGAESIKIAEISQWSGKGRHTTTVTSWYHLPDGGAVIDSPGIREFGLYGVEAAEV